MFGEPLCCLILLTQIVHYSFGEIYAVKFESEFYYEQFEDAPSSFGGKLSDGVIRALLANAEPPDACTSALKPPPSDEDNALSKWVVIVPRYDSVRNCTFEQKVRMGQLAGYQAVIIYNTQSNELVHMSAKNSSGIFIPSVFVGENAGAMLSQIYTKPEYYVIMTAESPFNIQTHLLIPFAIVVGICFIVMIIFMVVKCIQDRRRQQRHRLPASTLNKIPTCKYQKGDPYDTCAICLDDYIEGEKLRVLPCNHVYHTKCIDPWLTKNKRVCPICKRKVFAHDETQTHDSDSESEADDTTPLINSGNRGTQGGTFDSAPSLNPFQRAIRSFSQQSGVTNLAAVTASDHHSINGDPDTDDSSTTTASTNSACSYGSANGDRLDVEIHQPNSDVVGRDNDNEDADGGGGGEGGDVVV